MARLNRKTRRLTVSVTELIQFQTCRRRWLLSRTYTGSTEAPALVFGSMIHKGLEGFFTWKLRAPQEPKAWRAGMLDFYDRYVEQRRVQAANEYGMLWEQASIAFEDLIGIGREILQNYAVYDKTAEIPINPKLIERRIFIPLDSQKRNVLTMRWDVMGTTYNGLTAIVDHKTSGGLHAQGSTLDLDEQMTGYAYGYWRVHNRERLADQIVYDVLSKKVPAEPRVLKSGELSKDKSQDTVYSLYRKKIKEMKLDPNDYWEVLETLQEKGWSNYFIREASPRNVEQLKNYENRVRIIFEEMRAAIEDPQIAYPSPGPIKCPHCPFRDVCVSMEDGSDAQYLLDSAYVRSGSTPYTLPPRYREMTG